MRILLWVLLSALPAVAFRVLWAGLQHWTTGNGWRRRQEQGTAERSLELLVADLRRLEDEFRRTEAAPDVPYRGARRGRR